MPFSFIQTGHYDQRTLFTYYPAPGSNRFAAIEVYYLLIPSWISGHDALNLGLRLEEMSMRILSRIASGAVATAMLTATASAEGVAPQTTALLKFMPEEISAVRLLLARPVTAQPGDDREDRAALITFYGCSAAGPLWIGRTGLLPKAQTAIAELKKAADWGLNAADFKLPEPPAAGSPAMTTEQLADAEQKLSLAVLKYTRYAHGGRIPDPATQLSSYLDRKPVLPDAASVLTELMTQRGFDFYLEGHRLADFRRNPANVLFVPVPGATYFKAGFAPIGNKTCYPIPLAERDNNPNF